MDKLPNWFGVMAVTPIQDTEQGSASAASSLNSDWNKIEIFFKRKDFQVINA